MSHRALGASNTGEGQAAAGSFRTPSLYPCVRAHAWETEGTHEGTRLQRVWLGVSYLTSLGFYPVWTGEGCQAYVFQGDRTSESGHRVQHEIQGDEFVCPDTDQTDRQSQTNLFNQQNKRLAGFDPIPIAAPGSAERVE